MFPEAVFFTNCDGLGDVVGKILESPAKDMLLGSLHTDRMQMRLRKLLFSYGKSILHDDKHDRKRFAFPFPSS